MAADEKTEGDPEFGWLSAYNELVRNPTAAVSAGAANAIQTSDGAGALLDSGATAAAGVITATELNSDAHKNAAASVQGLNYVGTRVVLGLAGASNVAAGAPILGYATPYGAHGDADVDMLDADYTLLAAEYECTRIKIAGVVTAPRTLTFPDAAAGKSYVKLIWNVSGFNITLVDTTHPGVGIDINTGFACWVMVDSTGLYRATPETDPLS